VGGFAQGEREAADLRVPDGLLAAGFPRWPAPGQPGQAGLVLPVVDLADEALIENADVRRGVGRPGDGVVVTVTLFSGSRGRVLGTVTAAAGQGRARTGR
jgi:hypothetical protein